MRRRHSRIGVVVLLLTAALLAGCGKGDGNKGGLFQGGGLGTATPASGSRTATGGLSPLDLYQALLGAPFDDRELPSGFTSADVSAGDLSGDFKTYHAVGHVRVGVDGPDFADAIEYAIFNNESDAKGHFDNGKLTDVTVTGSASPAGLSGPAKCTTGTAKDRGKDVGITACVVLVGNVEVLGGSAITTDTKKGNTPSAIALAAAGLTHLRTVQANPQARATRTATAARTSTTTTNLTRTATATSTVARTVTATVTAARTPTSTATPSPQALYNTLLNSPVAANELPAGFSNPDITRGELGVGPKTYNAVGEVDIELKGPDTGNGIIYIVYPTERDAKGRFDTVGPTEQGSINSTFEPPGFSYPAKCFIGSSSSGTQKNGVTVCIVQVGTVEVEGLSVLASNPNRGTNDNAVALAKAGVAHLLRVQGR